ncbi:hypothetical protein R6Q59_007194, partial [Mikania micrantha]
MDKTRSSLVKRLAVNGPKEIRPSNCCCRLHGWPKVSLEKKRWSVNEGKRMCRVLLSRLGLSQARVLFGPHW